ncbi:MAG TPA: endolytic transglycosylase MltG [Bacteroidetes bacterium]|nr:endolytic transglycosylase MltG [Bacteroidota bacterium]
MSLLAKLHIKSCHLIVVVSLFLISFLLVFFSRYNRLETDNALIPGAQTLLLHDDGELRDLIPLLQHSEFEFDVKNYEWALQVYGYQSFRAGRYEINEPISFIDFFFKLSQGLQDPFNVVISSGMEQDRLIQRVASRFRFSAQDLSAAMNDSTLLSEIMVEAPQLIGRMIPNTYEMYWTTSARQFILRMMQEFDKAVLIPYSERAEELGMTIDQITTLASIIEWEVRHVDEKPRVSGLYWNRLNRRMRLQADPTVAYAIGVRRRLQYSDYRVAHPYNTYRINGLPPGPLNNPRLTSIQAALYPEDHNYLFMVATPEGYHAFTTNYQDHLRESRKWTNWLREQQRIRERMEAEAKTDANAQQSAANP